jgi:MOSC domain-containing protein YiiM
VKATLPGVSRIISVNLGVTRELAAADLGITGIDKRPTDAPVRVRRPGPKKGGLGSGLVGDQISDLRHHGGEDQAVYAYAREDLDVWAAELGRDLPGGVFGENLTTHGVDVNGALVGERWRIGEEVVLEVCEPRIPCRTFAGWIAQRGWIKRFTVAALPGAYLRVVEEGEIRSGDPVTVEFRPDHDVTVAMVFRATTLEPELLSHLLVAPALPEEVRQAARRRIAPAAAVAVPGGLPR